MEKVNTIEELFKDTPEMIRGAIELKTANTPILIHKGKFILKQNTWEIKVNGKITYEWLPSSGAKFSGKAKLSHKKLVIAFQTENDFELIIEGLNFGKCFLSSFSLGSFNHPTLLTGVLSNQAVKGDKSIPVNQIKFSIPNLKEIHGQPVKKTLANQISSSRGRLIFENNIHTITIDKCFKYKELQDSLDAKGGFIIQYVGELKKKKGNILFEESKNLFHCFSTFISFLNGRRTSILFSQGVFNEEIIWTDYTDYSVDSFKRVFSWCPNRPIEGLNELWQSFSQLWENENDSHFLQSAIHWYIEANSNKGYPEGFIIMAQTGLELIYNWLLIDQNKLLIGNDAENISASNKIRLLLSYLNVSTDYPKSFTNLKSVTDTVDAPDAFVQIRNAIVHSQEIKRKKLMTISSKTKFEALQLALWYIELSLLKILKYNGVYNSRSSKEIQAFKSIQLVPWAK